MNEPQSASKLVAPVRHTVVLILIFLTITMAGVLYQRRVATSLALFHRRPMRSRQRVPVCFSTRRRVEMRSWCCG